MVRLAPMPDREREEWLVVTWADYRTQLLSTGYTPEEASSNIEQNQSALFVDGVPNESQNFFDIMNDELRVGSLWLASRQERSAGEWYVYDIVIADEFRSQGFGRAAMRAAEDYVKSQGGTKLALNVFGPNKVARGLYESLGYSTMAIEMRKDLV